MKKIVGLAAIVAAMLIAVSGPALATKTAGQHIDDTTLASSTKAALIDNDKVSAGDINIEVNKGAVQLAGFMDSDAEKAAALATATKVEGVTKVIDALVVLSGHRSMGEALDDTTIQTKLKTGLVGAEGLGDAVAITTEVRQGHVLLAGFVDSAKEKDHAGQVAEGITGVKKVHNLISGAE